MDCAKLHSMPQHCATMHSCAFHCSVVSYDIVHCSKLRWYALRYIALPKNAMFNSEVGCNASQCEAVKCGLLRAECKTTQGLKNT